jgi:hypothetical protein
VGLFKKEVRTYIWFLGLGLILPDNFTAVKITWGKFLPKKQNFNPN